MVKWDENVARAKELYRNRHGHQMQIAELCLEVCTITRGGHVNDDRYTLAKFAKESSINLQTLSNWICVKRNVYDKIDSAEKHSLNFTTLSNASRFLGPDASDKQVRDRVKKLQQGGDYELKIMRYAADLRAVAHNFESPSNVERCSQKLLEEIYYYAKLITFALRRSRRKLTPQEHGLAAKTKIRASAIDTSKKLQTQYYLDDLGFKIKITRKDLKILEFLQQFKKPMTPTQIGLNLTTLPKSSTSAWACRSLNKWVALKKVKQNKNKTYEAI